MLLYIDKDGSLRYGAGALDDCYVIGFAAIEVYSFGCTEQRIVATLQSQTNYEKNRKKMGIHYRKTP